MLSDSVADERARLFWESRGVDRQSAKVSRWCEGESLCANLGLQLLELCECCHALCFIPTCACLRRWFLSIHMGKTRAENLEAILLTDIRNA